MERYQKGEDRDQLSILPLCLDDMIAEDAEVRALEMIVDKMDIRALGFTHQETKTTGRKPYDPVDMFKMYAYSYFNGIRSSRKMERECGRNMELMWLIGGLKPDFKTIADFRRDNKQSIRMAFQRFSMICSELGLIGKEIVAVDGSKFRASNSRAACHSELKVNQKIKHYTELADEYMALLDACDSEESDQPKYTRKELTDKIDSINQRISELNELKEVIAEKGTIYETDPDARMMKMNNNGKDICHNVQTAVDAKAHLVVAVDVTSQPIDKEQLYNMASQAKENLGVDELTVLADRGYYSAKQFKQCADDNITAYVPKVLAGQSVTRQYDKEMFRYDEKRNGYVCPQGQLLAPICLDKYGCTKYANIAACQNCSCKSECTTGKYRTIQDRPFAEYAREVDKQTKSNPEMRYLRKQLAEHPFGSVKRCFGFTHFLTRGRESVRAESCLHFLIYNIKRTMNVVGKRELMAALRV